jgi:HEAT repeat protein
LDPLKFLWLASWFLAACAIVWMSILVLARVGRDALARRRALQTAAIESIYLALMRGEAGAVEALAPYRRKVSLLAECLLRILDVVRGGERERLVGALQAFGLDDLLCKGAESGDFSARLVRVEALGVFPGPGAEQILRRVSRRGRGELRLAAAKALASMGAKGDLGELISDMARRKEPWAGSMGEVLRLLAEQQPEDCAVLFSKTDLPDPVRAMLAEALGNGGDYRNVLGLAEAALSAPTPVRVASVIALGRLMHPACAPALAAALNDADWQVRGAAARAAGDVGLIDLAPRLADHLSDRVRWISSQGADALARLGAKGLARLREAAREGSDAVARVASLTLAERGLT